VTRTGVVLERESANDDEAVVVAVHVPSGSRVSQDEPLFDVESSKATQEVTAPAVGYLRHELKVGDVVRYGVVIAEIDAMMGENVLPADAPSIEEPSPAAASSSGATAPEIDTRLTKRASRLRVSRRASELANRVGVDPAELGEPFVTVKLLEDWLAGRRQGPASPEPAMPARPAPTAPRPLMPLAIVDTTNPVSPHKRTEIEALASGAGAGMLSVIGVQLGPVDRRAPDNPFFEDRIIDLVAYEAARLMRRHSRLNACYRDGAICHYAEVNAGIAFDDGGRLLVYAVRNADRLHLTEIQNRITEGLEHYVERRMTAQDTSSATFTITDLSGAGVDFVWPLLPAGQSCIIAISRTPEHGYGLYVGFDHRVTEGREVAGFAAELRRRLRSFATRQKREPPACGFCGKLAAEDLADGAKGLILMVADDGGHRLCCRTCFDGW